MRNLTITSLGEIIDNSNDSLLNYENLSDSEKEYVNKTDFLREKYDNGRFRVYGIDRKFLLVTEFIYFEDDEAAKKEIYDTAEIVGAKASILIQCPHEDKVIHNYGRPDQGAAIGPNHGRMETQVEFAWEFDSPEDLEAVFNSKNIHTQIIWNKYGVSVI